MNYYCLVGIKRGRILQESLGMDVNLERVDYKRKYIQSQIVFFDNAKDFIQNNWKNLYLILY